MIEELRTHYQMRDAVTITGIDLGHLLNMLIELRWMIDAYTRGYVAEAQMAAFAMATLLNGMQRNEIRVMTDAMIASGERMSLSKRLAAAKALHS